MLLSLTSECFVEGFMAMILIYRVLFSGPHQRSGCKHVSMAQNPGSSSIGSSKVCFFFILKYIFII